MAAGPQSRRGRSPENITATKRNSFAPTGSWTKKEKIPAGGIGQSIVVPPRPQFLPNSVLAKLSSCQTL